MAVPQPTNLLAVLTHDGRPLTWPSDFPEIAPEDTCEEDTPYHVTVLFSHLHSSRLSNSSSSSTGKAVDLVPEYRRSLILDL
ncbi:hypothetical protein DCAR_0934846 [Daucus carota subsp. sativus]|uniref:Uncharacterized protein n=1 Tax=Daucus carota subsp. sativus TaxID=79200 RepID=A0A175YGQ7_DAUCS|nr:hypothetical protein DCAR_0934846 [Daucus carota subsp. sativus]